MGNLAMKEWYPGVHGCELMYVPEELKRDLDAVPDDVYGDMSDIMKQLVMIMCLNGIDYDDCVKCMKRRSSVEDVIGVIYLSVDNDTDNFFTRVRKLVKENNNLVHQEVRDFDTFFQNVRLSIDTCPSLFVHNLDEPNDGWVDHLKISVIPSLADVIRRSV